jgi:hypothetical protein
MLKRMPLDLTIVQPSHYHSKTGRRVFKTHRRALVPLTLPYLAALTPADWHVKLVDEQIEDIDYDRHTDLVAITSWTLHSPRAYDIAAEFRRGVKVIMGGPHVFFLLKEAKEHCDAVGIGEAEPIWARMLNDAAASAKMPDSSAGFRHDSKPANSYTSRGSRPAIARSAHW